MQFHDIFSSSIAFAFFLPLFPEALIIIFELQIPLLQFSLSFNHILFISFDKCDYLKV